MSVAYPQVANMPTQLPPPIPFPPLAPVGLHLEMWAHLSDSPTGQYQRLTADVGDTNRNSPDEFPGFQVVRAIDPNDRCLIRGIDSDDERCGISNPRVEGDDVCGASLFSRKAQIVTPDTTAELLQTGLVLQARKVTNYEVTFNAVDPTITGRAPTALLALVRANPQPTTDPRLTLPAITTTTAEEPTASGQRLTACTNYRKDGPGSDSSRGLLNPNFYVGNPRQYTKPLSGTLFGVFTFSTSSNVTPDLPNQNFSGITFSVPINLTNIDDFLVTLEPTTGSPPSAPSMTRVLYQGIRQPEASAGRGTIRLVMRLNVNPTLNPPSFMTAGTAAILTNLDSSLD